jgi:hypothetical protein
MSTTAERLQSYIAAEARILEAQSLGRGDRRLQLAELEQVRKGIDSLRGQLAVEQAAAQGAIGPRVMVADFSREL